MSDTPKTDAMMTALLWRTGETLPTDVEFGNFARQLERENAALQKENAALRADAERYRYIKNSETMEVSEILQSFCVSITFDLDAAIDAARKEAQPCQCTNGVIRSVGRDNDEVIEDCPDCSGSKEVQP